MYDVFFISYGETNAENHFDDLKSYAPLARRIKNVAGIHAAHDLARQRSRTSHFFVVDADSVLTKPDVLFYQIPEWDQDYVHLWFAENPSTGKSYGWGGLKLFPKSISIDRQTLDMTTSFPLKIIEETVSITRFNSSPLEAWRSAFRESFKLSRANDPRLDDWRAADRGDFLDEVRDGVASGIAFHESGGDPSRINDYDWLDRAFARRSK